MSERGYRAAAPFGLRSRWDRTPKGLLQCLRRWRRARRVRRERVPWPLWRDTTVRLATLDALSLQEHVRLRQLAGSFLREKVFSAAGNLTLDDSIRVSIAAQACLLIVNRGEGLAPFDGWTEIIVYPDAFRVRRETLDDAGVMHISDDELAGESWDRGPVVLSWGDINAGAAGADLHGAVILHEFAHKLDARSGSANGMPPLPRHMSRTAWTDVFTRAYETLCAQVDAGADTLIDPYAAEAPAEFFAVATEYVFEDPATLQAACPAVYDQLVTYYGVRSGTGSGT